MRSENLNPPPPESVDPAAEGPKGKRPWSKPRLRIMDMIFSTKSGSNPTNLRLVEGVRGGPYGPSYRTS